jgi:hypothetical protein
MNELDYLETIPGSVTICDLKGEIIKMNLKAKSTFSGDLTGSNVLDCHPEPSRTKLRELLATEGTNVYTIEKKGKKKIIYQAPWYIDGVYSGLIELSFEIPFDMPHFKRAS